MNAHYVSLMPDHIVAQTLYDSRFEHDACGIAILAQTTGTASHELVERALRALVNMTHRGAVAADGITGDGAGMLLQLPLDVLVPFLRAHGHEATPGTVAVAQCFLPPTAVKEAQAIIRAAAERQGLVALGWREVPIDESVLGEAARRSRPAIWQLIVVRPSGMGTRAFERACYRARKAAERALQKAALEDAYIASFSSRTVVYKGMVQPAHLDRFYLDLQDPACRSAVAVVHTRFSTNTFPSWARAQPFRMVCHNGEINTLQGNVNWMRAREVDLPPELCPVIDERGSDSAMVDNTVEMLVHAGRDIRHVLLMLFSDAWDHHPDLSDEVKAFYAYHEALIEPWDGPAGVCFTDGRVAGARLDRNGLRPLRYDITGDGLLVVASEAGAAELDPSEVVEHGRVGAGEMIAADVVEGYIEHNGELKRRFARQKPYTVMVERLRHLETSATATASRLDTRSLQTYQIAFGYTSEEVHVLVKPMVWHAKEPIGSMGDDTPHAVFSRLPRPLFHYFKQRFAEVTNPPIDPIRERSVLSLRVHVGAMVPLLEVVPDVSGRLVLESPFITESQLQELEALGHHDARFRARRLDATFPAADGPAGLERAVHALREAAANAVREGITLLILDDSSVNPERAPIPSLMAVGAVHHHLLRLGLRARCSIVAYTGEPRDPHQLATLIGYGANAVCPWLALETAVHIGVEGYRGKTLAPEEAVRNYLQAAENGLLKIMTKMGIATAESYCGAQIFEAIGLNQQVIEECFAGTPFRIGGVGYDVLGREVLEWHRHAFDAANGNAELPSFGYFKYKKQGEYHAFNPQVVRALQKAVRIEGVLNGHFEEGFAAYREYANLVDNAPPAEPRDFLALAPASPVPLDEVEPAEAIVRRFSTAAISFGSISAEAHEAMAMAMNRLGGMSNSGEGGEDPGRFGTERNSACKQVASGRFGVTPAYLMSARELQIKMAQGSKPGEGGHLPGRKVTVEIAAIRHTEPGTPLISPPPHHDIYSIEDLAQLISDLRTINPDATISVKLVAQAGVGTIAAGVVKAGADVVLISGDSGGTGASPITSIKHAGVPWELGLAETQQTLIANGLRDRVRLRVDGGLRTARDVLIAALLGADEFSFGTSALVAEGCVMARACHMNTCPVGIATQKPELRAKFTGKPEHIMAFFLYIAEDLRHLLAQLGARSLDEVIGRSDLLTQVPTEVPADLDMRLLLTRLPGPRRFEGRVVGRRLVTLDERIKHDALRDLALTGRSRRTYTVRNVDRTVGAGLAGELARRHGDIGLPDDTVHLHFIGAAGQSFGAFILPGMTLRLEGVANDYVGKGMAGGRIVLMRPEDARWPAEAPILGNVALYGATGGELFAAGRAGDRFAVRNSGATAVVEGVGAHGCEYMTGGVVVILGPTGYNFAAGMSGGVAYVYDPQNRLPLVLNREFVDPSPLSEEDVERVRALIERHVVETGSRIGRLLLSTWTRAHVHFVKVAPRPHDE
ncbi:MAG: glutamate synthase large subunit [Ardenticatenia bacterium]|nr:glutamate synthase large subunit [Ardenticatenia bacterium]